MPDAHAPASQRHVVPFYGDHQAGITTPAQDRLHMAAFDVITEDRGELIALLKDWTDAAAAHDGGQAKRAPPARSTGRTMPRRKTPARLWA